MKPENIIIEYEQRYAGLVADSLVEQASDELRKRNPKSVFTADRIKENYNIRIDISFDAKANLEYMRAYFIKADKFEFEIDAQPNLLEKIKELCK